MGVLKDVRWMYLKAILFLAIGIVSTGLILLQAGSWQIVLLLSLAIWSFARLYYFMFYVIEHYVDPQYKFAGLFSFLQWFLSKKK